MDLFQIIAVGQIIIFPILLVGGGFFIFLTYHGKRSFWSFFYLAVFLLVVILIGLPLVINNWKILTGKCKKCKGKLGGRELYSSAWNPWKNPRLICLKCRMICSNKKK